MTLSCSCVPRARNAAATRQAMLDSARRHFAREPYENVGLREIARDAGADPALISRYFGGKAQLFRAALCEDDEDFLAGGVTRAGLPGYFADMLVEDEAAEDDALHVQRLLIMLHSAASASASRIVRESFEEELLRPIVALMEGAHAEARAGLCIAVIMGAGLLRSTLGTEPIDADARAMLRDRLIAMFEVALA